MVKETQGCYHSNRYEIVEPGSDLKKGDIIEFNSRILGGLVSEWGGEPVRFGIVPDNLEELKRAIQKAHDEGDLIVINAGASAGSEDFTVQAISELGEVILHGVSINRAAGYSGMGKGKPVIGIPVILYLLITFCYLPGLLTNAGLRSKTEYSDISRQVASPLGQEEFMRLKVGKVGDNFIATPISRGAGVLMSLVRADGFARIPAMSEGMGAGSLIDVELMRSRDDIENTIVCIGSHDNALDLLANILKKRYPGTSLSSAHVGSMGGLIALKRGEAHLAGTHLLDEETGEYNITFIKKLLSDKKIFLITLFEGKGLLVPRQSQNIKD
jgi:putative molybdopterin biosynthesis protein